MSITSFNTMNYALTRTMNSAPRRPEGGPGEFHELSEQFVAVSFLSVVALGFILSSSLGF